MNGESGIFRKYLGWCPHAARSHNTGVNEREGSGPAVEKRVPEASPAAHATVPDGFTLLSILILFATLFVGGYFWWPALVLGITIAGILAFRARTKAQGGD